MAHKRVKLMATGKHTFDEGPVIIDFVYWYEPAAADDDFEINGYLIGICVTAKESQLFPMTWGPVESINVTTLDSGTLYVYYTPMR